VDSNIRISIQHSIYLYRCVTEVPLSVMQYSFKWEAAALTTAPLHSTGATSREARLLFYSVLLMTVIVLTIERVLIALSFVCAVFRSSFLFVIFSVSGSVVTADVYQ